MTESLVIGAAPRVVLLARAGKAADNLADALRQAGADLVMSADPTNTDEAALRAHRPQVVLVALEPSIEQALDKLDGLLVDPALTVIYDEADLAAHRAGWDAARWVRHLSAKLRHDNNVLPPGTESDQEWQPSPGQIPKPSAAYADADLAAFTREAVARADSVPSDGMQAEPLPQFTGALSLDAALLDAIPVAAPAEPPPAPPAASAVLGIESFEIESFESSSFEASAVEINSIETSLVDSVSLESVDFDSAAADGLLSQDMSIEGMSIESVQLDGFQLDSVAQSGGAELESMQLESMQFEDSALHSGSTTPAANSVAPMQIDDDAFFLETLSATDAVPLTGDAATPIQLDGGFDGGFDAGLDFDMGDTSDFDTLPAAGAAAGDVPLFATSEAPPQPESAVEFKPSFSLGDLSLTPVDDVPAVAAKRMGASPTHDLSVLEARISSLSLVDLDAVADTPRAGCGIEAAPVVLIEASLGGPDPVRQLLSSIPGEFPAIVLVRLHLQGGRYDRLVAQMERAAALPVALAESGASAIPGTIYFLPDGIGLDARNSGVGFVADGAPAAAIFGALPAGNSAVVFLSGSDPQLVDTAMTAGAGGALVVAQSPEDCYDGAACAELRNRGAVSGLPAELAGRLASRWPS